MGFGVALPAADISPCRKRVDAVLVIEVIDFGEDGHRKGPKFLSGFSARE